MEKVSEIILQKDKKAKCCGLILKAGTKVKVTNQYNGRHVFVILDDGSGHKILLRTKK